MTDNKEFELYVGINGQPVQRHEKGLNVILSAILVLLLGLEPFEVFSAYILGYHRKEKYNNLILETQKH